MLKTKSKKKIQKKYQAKFNNLVEYIRASNDRIDLVTTIYFLLILFVAYLILSGKLLFAGLVLLIASGVRHLDDVVIYGSNVVTKLKKFYNLIVSTTAESLSFFSIIVYYHSRNLYVGFIFILLLFILNFFFSYLYLLAQSSYKIKKPYDKFKKVYLLLLFVLGLLIDQLLVVIILGVVLKSISIYKIIEQIKEVLFAKMPQKKTKKAVKSKKKKITKKIKK